MTILHGNCIDLMPTLPAQSIDLVLVDPPHGRTNCHWDTVIPFAPLWEGYRHVLRPDGVVVVIATQPYTSLLICSNPAWYRYCWVWSKWRATGWLNAKKRPLPSHEDIVVFSPKPPRYYPIMASGTPYVNRSIRTRCVSGFVYGEVEYGDKVRGSDGPRYPRSVLTLPAQRESYKGEIHPTRKPVNLLSYLIKTYTQPGDTVLDNCMGSGSTGAACLETGRNFIGIELDEAYYDCARRRLTSPEG